MSDISTSLSERFPIEDHKSRQAGGANLTYVPTGKYIERMLGQFGASYSWEIHHVTLDPDKRYAMVCGRLTYSDEVGGIYTKDGVGVGQDLTHGQKEELDKILKTANSEAFKNACKLMGVGLYLYDMADLEEVQAEMRQGGAPSKYAQPQRQMQPDPTGLRPDPEPVPRQQPPANDAYRHEGHDVKQCRDCGQPVIWLEDGERPGKRCTVIPSTVRDNTDTFNFSAGHRRHWNVCPSNPKNQANS